MKRTRGVSPLSGPGPKPTGGPFLVSGPAHAPGLVHPVGLVLTLGLFLALGLAACGDDDPVSPRIEETEAEFASRVLATAVGTHWELTAFIEGERTARVAKGTSIDLYLAEGGQATGSAGCNQYFASYELLDSARVSFGGIGSTEMACVADGVMAQEARYLRSLRAGTALSLSEGYLHLHYGEGGAYLRFAPGSGDSAGPADPGTADPDSATANPAVVDTTVTGPEALVDRFWQLRFFEYHNDMGAFSERVPEDIEITAVFSADGHVKGRAGCNEYFAQYELSGDGGLSLHDVGITEMFCQVPELMEWEDRFRALLADLDTYRAEGERLSLSYGDGSGVLHFEPGPRPADPPDTPAVQEDSVWVDDNLLRYTVLPCTRDEAVQIRSSDSGVVVADGGDIHFRQEILTYCNAQTGGGLAVRPVIDGDQITLNAVFSGPAVRCLCPIPVGGVVEDLAPGTYTVTIVYGVELADGTHMEPELLTSVEVVVGDGTGGGDPGVSDPDDGGPWIHPEPPPADLQLAASDHGDTIELSRPGALVEISLEANPSTGYTWFVADVDSTTLLQVGEVFEASPDSPAGAPGTQRLYFEAQAPGHTTLRLVYARIWESVPAADTFEVSFFVNGGIVPPPIVPLPVDPPVNPLGIRLGSSFGECLGYCWQEMSLDEEAMVLVARGWDTAAYPEKLYREEMDPDLWRRLQSMADFTVLDRMEEVYGCPDCADGGAEWISMNLSGRMETVKFEYGTKLEPIAELAAVLRQVRDGLVERSGF